MWGESYESTSFEVLPKGDYMCVLDNCTIDKTKEKQTPYINMEFVVDGGEFSKRKIWHKLWFTDGAKDMTCQQLDNIYVFEPLKSRKAASAEQYMNNVADVLFKLVGKKFEVSVTGHQEYNGKEYPNTFLHHYVDVPNEAIQKVDRTDAKGATNGPAPGTNSSGVDQNEEIPF